MVEGPRLWSATSHSFASAKIDAPECSESKSIPSTGVLYRRLIVEFSRVDNRLSGI